MLDNITQNHHFDKKFISILIEGTIGSCSNTELSCRLIIVTDPSAAPSVYCFILHLLSTPEYKTGQHSSVLLRILWFCFPQNKICPNLWELLVFYNSHFILVDCLSWLDTYWLDVWGIHDLLLVKCFDAWCRYNTLIAVNDRIIVGISVWELARSCCYDDLQLVLFWLNHSDLLWIFRLFKYHRVIIDHLLAVSCRLSFSSALSSSAMTSNTNNNIIITSEGATLSQHTVTTHNNNQIHSKQSIL